MFDLEDFIRDGKSCIYPLNSVENLCIDGRGRVISKKYILEHAGIYPVYSSQTTNDGILGYIDTYDFDGEYLTWTTDGAKAGTIFYRNGKFSCTNVCGTLRAKSDINMRYLATILSFITYMYVNHVGNNKLMNTPMKKIQVPLPPKTLQDEFSDYVKSIDKLKFEGHY